MKAEEKKALTEVERTRESFKKAMARAEKDPAYAEKLLNSVNNRKMLGTARYARIQSPEPISS